MAKKIGNISVYNNIDPDTLYNGPGKAGSMTFIYVPKSNTLHAEPYPTNHRDMMEDDDVFADVYNGKKVSTQKERNNLSSRGQVLVNSNALLGRIGAAGDAICIALWTDPSSELFGNFLSKLFEKYPQFRAVQEKVLVVSPAQGARMLTDIIGGKTSPKRAVALKKKKAAPSPVTPPAQDDDISFEIGGGRYTLSQLQSLRSAIHTKGQAGPGLGDPHGVLCHPDMDKYPELSGYRPADCGGGSSPVRPTHPAMWRQAGRETGTDPYLYSYGEGFTFRDWIEFQDIFRS